MTIICQKVKKEKGKKNIDDISDTDSDSMELELRDSSDDENFLNELYYNPEREKSEDQVLLNNVTEFKKDSFVLVKFSENIHSMLQKL